MKRGGVDISELFKCGKFRANYTLLLYISSRFGYMFSFFFFIFILEEETGIRKWCRLIIDIINDVLLDKKERENVFSLSNCDEKKKVVYIKSGEIGLRDFSQERIPAHMLTCSSCYSV